MLYSIVHRTVYSYGSDVSHSYHLAHVRPRSLPRQEVLEYALRIDPEPTFLVERSDYNGNQSSFFTFGAPHRRLAITVRSRVRVRAPALPEAAQTPVWEEVRKNCASDTLTADSAEGEFCFNSPHITRSSVFGDYAAPSFPLGMPLLEGVLDFTRRIYLDFKFDPRATTIATPLDEVFQKRRGVCQDFAHLAIACLRSLGLLARYVSGYLRTYPAPGHARLTGADASHAWFSVFCPSVGWVDFDPTNNLLPGTEHITVAYGRDFSDVSPVSGSLVGGGAHHAIKVSVDVQEIEEGRP
jgi:transglutaminase-like putative cysteine protease